VKFRLLPAAAVAVLACCAPLAAVAQDDGYYLAPPIHYTSRSWSDGNYRYTAGNHIDVVGVVVRVNEDTGRIAVRSDSHRRYNVDTYNAEVVTPASASTDVSDNLIAGARVRVVGYRYGIGLIDADRVVVLPDDSDSVSEVTPVPAPAPPPVVDVPAPVDANPLPPVHVDAPAIPSVDTMRLEGVIKSIGDGRISIVGDDDSQSYDIKTADADIILPEVNRAGLLSDLSTGMRVSVVGERVDGGVIVADRIRVLPEEAVDVAPAPVHPAITDLSSYTGIIIDVSGASSRIQRSPSPAIYGPDMTLLYPDRSHVPTPDEVQDESIVRYYRSEDAAEAGVGGSHPLILQAQSVVGPAEDSVMLSSTDAALFTALDQRLQYTRNWKVGFLIPADR
jgi:hypothetical protein